MTRDQIRELQINWKSTSKLGSYCKKCDRITPHIDWLMKYPTCKRDKSRARIQCTAHCDITEPTRYKALDLYCGGGGAAYGLMQAGFEVTGIDIKPRRNYPGNFIQADVFDMPVNLSDYDFIWASPPCQRHSIATLAKGFDNTVHPCHIPELRELLKPHPFYAIENVPRAPLRTSLVLTGPAFGLKKLWRRRHFETSFLIWQPEIGKRPKNVITVTTSMCSNNHFYRRKEIGLKGRPPKWVAHSVMGYPRKIWFQDLMTWREIGESVPPPYSFYIAQHVLNLIKS